MSILALNSGSTSVKYKLFDNKENVLKKGCAEDVKDHFKAIKLILREIGDLRDLEAVGHRVVHGGERFSEPLIINEKNLSELEKANNLAPLHNPYNVAGIKAAAAYLPQAKQIAVFDTAFYANLPKASKYYALPLGLSDKYNLYRNGFHGISHKFVSEEAARLLKKKGNKINVISCHLGGGWSITAIKEGKPIDTSMGYTPMEGLAMISRTGDLDPGIIFKLLEVLPGEITKEKVNNLNETLNRQSGIKGICGLTDYQKLLAEKARGNESAKLAFELAIRRLVKYIGAYWVLLEGKVDAVIFTGSIGSGNPETRNEVMQRIKCLGKLPMLSIKTDEELMIAREVKKMYNSNTTKGYPNTTKLC